MFSLARQFVGSVDRNGYQDAAAIRKVVDECAAMVYAVTGDDFDQTRIVSALGRITFTSDDARKAIELSALG
jgi:hypothetical protein